MGAVEALLPLAAVILSLAAIVVAVLSDLRTRRATRALARELVQLRELIASGEVGPGAQVPDSGGETAAHLLAEVVTPRLERLERRLADALENPPTATPGTALPEDPEQRILAALRRQGYDGAVILESLADGRVLVEAERDGMTVKGAVRQTDDGTIELTAVTSARAFP